MKAEDYSTTLEEAIKTATEAVKVTIHRYESDFVSLVYKGYNEGESAFSIYRTLVRVAGTYKTKYLIRYN